MQQIQVEMSDNLTLHLDKMQQTQVDVPDDLASHLGRMLDRRTNATYRIGLLKYLVAIRVIVTNKDDLITDNKYWEIQNEYVKTSASYNACLAGIIAQVALRNRVTDMGCFSKVEEPYKAFIGMTEEWIKPKKLLVKFTADGKVLSSEAHNDTDDSKKQSPIYWYNSSRNKSEQELKLLEIRKSQSDIVNLLESFKWPDIGVILPQPLIVGTGEREQPKTEGTLLIDLSKFDCKELDLTTFTHAEEGGDNYINNKNLRKLLHFLRDEGVCNE